MLSCSLTCNKGSYPQLSRPLQLYMADDTPESHRRHPSSNTKRRSLAESNVLFIAIDSAVGDVSSLHHRVFQHQPWSQTEQR